MINPDCKLCKGEGYIVDYCTEDNPCGAQPSCEECEPSPYDGLREENEKLRARVAELDAVRAERDAFENDLEAAKEDAARLHGELFEERSDVLECVGILTGIDGNSDDWPVNADVVVLTQNVRDENQRLREQLELVKDGLTGDTGWTIYLREKRSNARIAELERENKAWERNRDLWRECTNVGARILVLKDAQIVELREALNAAEEVILACIVADPEAPVIKQIRAALARVDSPAIKKCEHGYENACPGCGTNLCARGCGRNLGPYEECACSDASTTPGSTERTHGPGMATTDSGIKPDPGVVVTLMAEHGCHDGIDRLKCCDVVADDVCPANRGYYHSDAAKGWVCHACGRERSYCTSTESGRKKLSEFVSRHRSDARSEDKGPGPDVTGSSSGRTAELQELATPGAEKAGSSPAPTAGTQNLHAETSNDAYKERCACGHAAFSHGDLGFAECLAGDGCPCRQFTSPTTKCQCGHIALHHEKGECLALGGYPYNCDCKQFAEEPQTPGPQGGAESPKLGLEGSNPSPGATCEHRRLHEALDEWGHALKVVNQVRLKIMGEKKLEPVVTEDDLPVERPKVLSAEEVADLRKYGELWRGDIEKLCDSLETLRVERDRHKGGEIQLRYEYQQLRERLKAAEAALEAHMKAREAPDARSVIATTEIAIERRKEWQRIKAAQEGEKP